MRKDMPDEVKNQVMPDGEKRVITEKIPEQYLKDMEDLKRKKQGLIQQFLQISVQLINVQQTQKDILDKVKDIDKKIGNIIDYAFKKMKLHKRKDRRWQLRGTDFVGVYNSSKPKSRPKQEENK